MSNEDFVRRAYEIAEVKDIPAWIACFNPDGVFVDESVAGLPQLVGIFGCGDSRFACKSRGEVAA